MRRNSCVLAALGLALLLPAIARAETYTYHYRGNAARATFADYGDPCITTWVDVSLAESHNQEPPGPPTAGGSIQVFVSQFDRCRYTALLDVFAYGVLPQDAFEMHGNLQSAHLGMTLQGYDSVSGAAVPLVIDLAWSGTGDLTRSHSARRTMYPGYKFRSRANGDLRYADITGSVAAGTFNLTVAPGSGTGILEKSTGGSVSIQR